MGSFSGLGAFFVCVYINLIVGLMSMRLEGLDIIIEPQDQAAILKLGLTLKCDFCRSPWFKFEVF